MEPLVGDDQITVLAAPELKRELALSSISVTALTSGEGLGRFIALNRIIRSATNGPTISAAMFHQYAPERINVPFVLRLTDAHLVEFDDSGVVENYDSRVGRLGWAAKRFFFKRSARRASTIICATQSLAASLIATQPDIDPKKIKIAKYGPSLVVDRAVRHSGAGGNRLLTMHIRPHKNIEVILRAMAQPSMEDFTLTVLGTLSPKATPYEALIKTLIDDLDLETRVHFAGYLSDPSQVRESMMNHDILVVSSRLESWSHSLLEGLAMGMPVVASDLNVHKELGSQGAWIFRVDSHESLAESLFDIRANSSIRQLRVSEGIDATSGLSWNDYAAACVDALREADEH
jgi:glycosyltransferase involved in cell wall biosynthesis